MSIFLTNNIYQQEREFVKAFLFELNKIRDFSESDVEAIFCYLYKDLELYFLDNLTQRMFLRLRPHPIQGPKLFNSILQTLSYGIDKPKEENLEAWFGKDFSLKLSKIISEYFTV